MVGVVGWLTSHDIRQHIFRTWYCFCARRSIMVTVSLGTGSFPSSKKIPKIPEGGRRFPKTCVFFCGVRKPESHTHIQQQKKVKRDKHQDTKLTRFCWNGIPTGGEGFCPKNASKFLWYTVYPTWGPGWDFTWINVKGNIKSHGQLNRTHGKVVLLTDLFTPRKLNMETENTMT